MKQRLKDIYHSFPVQLVILHFKKFQVLLLFWYLLFSTVSGDFMHSYGADSLFLAPEYLGHVNAAGAAILGAAIGVFIMSWNITTFILFSRHFRFLATNSNPFLKYCINNSLIPLAFLIFYFIRSISFARYRELMPIWEVFVFASGFIGGFVLLITISFIYFFRADKTILSRIAPMISNPHLFKSTFWQKSYRATDSRLIKVDWYLNALFRAKKPRDVRHYDREFIETIFSRHHFAAVVAIFVAFVFLIVVGFNLDKSIFQLPAAAGITVFFAILIAISGAISYFMQSWSIVFLVALLFITNLLYRTGVIDPSNKAYGLNYTNRDERPAYSQDQLAGMTSADSIRLDMDNMIRILENWKAKQKEDRPMFYIINTSGGGNRSATFTMNVLQKLDSISGGTLLDKTFLITGASGGMLGATYFRELWRRRDAGFNPQDKRYVNDISQDLLNSLFTSFVARDLAAPAQKFKVGDQTYIKDRGYAFEQKLNENTRGILNSQLRDYEEDERMARIPMILFNSVITRDGRKLVISTQPVRFLMKPPADSVALPFIEPDALDFQSFFQKQDPMNLRMLSALRMNATFPYVLPNVWLPATPVFDVMDAGLRDNYGPETAVRFLQVFRNWILENTGGVVLVQITDRKTGGWDNPFNSDDISEIFTKPILLLQYNWYKMQEYSQNDLLTFTGSYLENRFQKITFQYVPRKEDEGAALNFHLTKREKRNISEALHTDLNVQAFQQFSRLTTPSSQHGSITGRR